MDKRQSGTHYNCLSKCCQVPRNRCASFRNYLSIKKPYDNNCNLFKFGINHSLSLFMMYYLI
uniref:Uncharacterized protein n=1 Tax=Setaria viridis TaxID=4556 RepID=A0A4U6VF84_SETVI|nr:hypothetical protein SEVIR_3G232000v2 [Setaria viridis]